MDEINARGESQIVIRQVKYLNNLVEQDHRAIKRVTRPMLNFKTFLVVQNDLKLSIALITLGGKIGLNFIYALPRHYFEYRSGRIITICGQKVIIAAVTIIIRKNGIDIQPMVNTSLPVMF